MASNSSFGIQINQAAGPTTENAKSDVSSASNIDSYMSSRKRKPNQRIQSCQFCRRRKIRCDKATPSCSPCLKATAECVYPMRKSRSSVSSSVLGLGPQAREEQLLKRIGKLESAIQDLKVQGQQVVTSLEVVSMSYKVLRRI